MSIFSTYSQGENRVTASILAVLRSLAIGRIDKLLGALVQADVQIVTFENQPAGGSPGVPDAEISSSFFLIIETKKVRNVLTLSQLKQHLVKVEGEQAEWKMLLVLTPDDTEPAVVGQLGSSRVAWSNFSGFSNAIDELLADEKEVVSEREAFLLRELQIFFEESGLIRSARDTVVVPARLAWDEYLEVYAYVCQAERAFQTVTHMAFYRDGAIENLVPRILDVHDAVEFRLGSHQGHLGHVVDTLLNTDRRRDGAIHKVFLLTSPEEAETVRLPKRVQNDVVSRSGAIVAFTQNQRYVSLEKLRRAERTSELIID